MATIEPRLIHLLNNSTTPPQLPSSDHPVDLPPLQIFPFHAGGSKHPSDRPLPLEPDAHHRPDQSASQLPPPVGAVPHLYPLTPVDDVSPSAALSVGDLAGKPGDRSSVGNIASYPLRLLLGEGDVLDSPPSSHSLRQILDDTPDPMDDVATKKRHRAITVKDDLVHLPQPIKKQKATQAMSFPPIINGLHEPPPDAALFPPIAANSYEDGQLTVLRDLPNVIRDERTYLQPPPPMKLQLQLQFQPAQVDMRAQNMRAQDMHSREDMRAQEEARAQDFRAQDMRAQDIQTQDMQTQDMQIPDMLAQDMQAQADMSRQTEFDLNPTQANTTVKSRKRAAKPRRKWTEEETTHLLLGVNKHGVGKWTNILEDAEFRFNDRNAGDLKDRFRTCCPNELRRASNTNSKFLPDSPTTPAAEPSVTRRTPSLLQKILVDPEPARDASHAPPESTWSPVSVAHNQEGESASRRSTRRTHRKKMEDLAHLGIHGPFKKSHRRERRPFTEQDDAQILEGLDCFGPAWTKIQRDPRFNLSTRQPTDLRDRVRNKYPQIYQSIEKGTFQAKDPSAAASEPSVNASVETGLSDSISASLDPRLIRVGSKEEIARWPHGLLDSSESPVGVSPRHSFEAPETTTSTAPYLGSAGEMDISRLLLVDDGGSNLPVRRLRGEYDDDDGQIYRNVTAYGPRAA